MPLLDTGKSLSVHCHGENVFTCFSKVTANANFKCVKLWDKNSVGASKTG